jgi:hypothetical protein
MVWDGSWCGIKKASLLAGLSVNGVRGNAIKAITA